MTVRRMNRVVAIALLAAIGGCAESPMDRDGNDQATVTVGQTVEGGASAPMEMATDGNDADVTTSPTPDTNPATPASPPLAPSTVPAPPAKGDVVLAVEGEGLRLFNSQTSAASPIAFGRLAVDVVTVLERLRGTASKGTNRDCGAGPVEYANWPDGLSLVFQRNRFVGWGLDRRAAGAIGTASSIGPGSTRAQLDDAYGDVRFTSSSIGQEFAVGGISGILDGASARSRITDMWAGVSCVAR